VWMYVCQSSSSVLCASTNPAGVSAALAGLRGVPTTRFARGASFRETTLVLHVAALLAVFQLEMQPIAPALTALLALAAFAAFEADQ